MLRTYKYRLSPTTRQIKSLNRTLEIYRILYNSCLADRRNHYQATGKGLSVYDSRKFSRPTKNVYCF